MSNCKPIDTHIAKNMNLVPYASVIGSLMYAMICTRPNIYMAPLTPTSRDAEVLGAQLTHS